MSRPDVLLGNTIDNTQERDAIHIAVIPARAGGALWAACPVRLKHDGNEFVAMPSVDLDKAIGIVDPFLYQGVEEGAYFYVCLKPYTITSLRHEWTHPELEKMMQPKPVPSNAKEAAHQYIEAIADDIGITYDRLVEGAREYCESGDPMNMGDNESYNNIGERQWSKFWSHFHTLTGLKPPDDNYSGNFFSCAC